VTTGLILAIDQGTTNTKVVAVDASGAIVSSGSVPTPLTFPRPGWVESDPSAIWASVQGAARACLEGIGGPGHAPITSVALTNQREAAVAWERATGRPLGPCISWQCRRTADACDDLRARGLEPLIRSRSGLDIDPLFSATKAGWLLDAVPDGRARARAGEICVGTVDSWVLWNLSGGASFATDLTNASRTQLLNLDRLRWDEELLEVFGIPAAALADVRPSSGRFGATHGLDWLPDGTPVDAVIGDSHGALFGHGAPAYGTVKATYGTGTSVMAPVARRIDAAGLSSTIAWSRREPSGDLSVAYAVEGNIAVTGASIDWLASIIGHTGQPERVLELAGTVEDSGGVYLVAALAGLGAPHWDAQARGLICGATRGTTAAHLARAAVEGVAYLIGDVLDALEPALDHPIGAVLADGGAIQSDLMAQVQADVLNRPVLRSLSGNLAAVGAAYLAGLANGTWQDVAELRALARGVDRFDPRGDAVTRDAGRTGWQVAVRRASGTLGTPPG
jgi:glycerol kinase